MARLSDKTKVDIIYQYSNCLATMADLAQRYKVSRQAIWKFLKVAGVEISKAPIAVTCNACHKEIIRHKHRIRKNHRNFCDHHCYQAFLQAGYGFGKYVNSRQGNRIARQVIAQYFPIQPEHVPHHINRNCLDNDPHNLMAFRNQGDHVRWHRGLILEVEPLWDGSKLIL